MGYNSVDRGANLAAVAMVAMIVGTMVGGIMTTTMGLGHSLWLFGAVQICSNIGYVLVARSPVNPTLMLTASAFDNLASGLGSGAFSVLLLRLTQKRFSATQYALFSSLFGLPRILAGPLSGYAVDAIGWEAFFWSTLLMGLPGMLLLNRFAPLGTRDPEFTIESARRWAPVSRMGLVARGVAGAAAGCAVTVMVLPARPAGDSPLEPRRPGGGPGELEPRALRGEHPDGRFRRVDGAAGETLGPGGGPRPAPRGAALDPLHASHPGLRGGGRREARARGRRAAHRDPRARDGRDPLSGPDASAPCPAGDRVRIVGGGRRGATHGLRGPRLAGGQDHEPGAAARGAGCRLGGRLAGAGRMGRQDGDPHAQEHSRPRLDARLLVQPDRLPAGREAPPGRPVPDRHAERRVESPHGRVRCLCRFSESVEPGTVWTWNAVGKAAGAWGLAPDANESRLGFLLNHLIAEELPPCESGEHMANADPVTGQAAWFDVRVRVYKAGPDEPARTHPQFPAQRRVPGQDPRRGRWQAYVAGLFGKK